MAQKPARRRKAPARKPAKPRSRRPAARSPSPPDEPGVDAGTGFLPRPPPSPPPPPPLPAWDAAAPGILPAPAAPAWPAVRPVLLPGAVAAMVLGIASVWMFPLGLLLGPLAIGFAAHAYSRHRADPALRGRGMATAGLATGIAGLVLSAGFVALMVSEEGIFFLDPGAEDRGADITAVQAGLLSRNTDADAARELVVAVAAWDDVDHGDPLGYAGRIEVVLESSPDGVAWTRLANRTVDVEPEEDFDSWPSAEYVEFEDAELDLGASYRAFVVVTVDATGARFEDQTRPTAGDELPDRFEP